MSIHVSGPSAPHDICCGQLFPSSDAVLFRSRTSTEESSVGSLAQSIQGLTPPSHEEVVHKLTYVAGRMQCAELAMDLARLQLKIALAIYMDCVGEYELERTVTHEAMHEASLSPAGLDLWRQALHLMRKGAMRSTYSCSLPVPFKTNRSIRAA